MASESSCMGECGGSEDPKETRILLIGKAGHGKSATGNGLLGRKMFETSVGTRIINKSTECKENQRFGKKLVIVDTPEFFDTDKHTEKTAREISKIMGYMHQGFHAMIYVMGPEKFSEKCIELRDLFFKVFGEGIAKYTIIIITHLDLLVEENFDREEYLSFTAKEFRDMQKKCGQRIVFFDNKSTESVMESQAKQVLDLVDKLGQINERPYFTNYFVRLAHAYFQLEQKMDTLKLCTAKQELFRRAARATGEQQPLYWNNEKQMPAKKKANNLLAVPAEIPRKGSHPEIRPSDLADHGQRQIPESKAIFFRRHSFSSDTVPVGLTGKPNSLDTVKGDDNITEIKDDTLDEFEGDVLEIFNGINSTDNALEDQENLMPETEDTIGFRKHGKDKDFVENFVNFFSYFLLPVVNVKRNCKK